MQACTATRFIATARARTHAGAELCVPADRLACTVTHAAPAPNVPAAASTVISVAAISRPASAHSIVRAVDDAVQRPLAQLPRESATAPMTAPMPNIAEQEAVAAGAEAELVARDDRQQRPQRARAYAERAACAG